MEGAKINDSKQFSDDSTRKLYTSLVCKTSTTLTKFKPPITTAKTLHSTEAHSLRRHFNSVRPESLYLTGF